jgi:hypothetical protein
VVIVDNLDEWLDLASGVLALLRHTASDLRWVALDTGDQGVRVWVRLVASVLWLDDHDLNFPPSANVLFLITSTLVLAFQPPGPALSVESVCMLSFVLAIVVGER